MFARRPMPGPFTIAAMAMISLGGAAVLAPIAPEGIAVVLLGGVIAFAGCAHLVLAFHPGYAGAGEWRGLVGAAYFVAGILIALNPGVGLLGLTLTASLLLMVEAALLSLTFFRLHALQRAPWILADALAALALGCLIAFLWPATSIPAIGMLFGAGLMMNGFAQLLYAGRHSRAEARPRVATARAPQGI